MIKQNLNLFSRYQNIALLYKVYYWRFFLIEWDFLTKKSGQNNRNILSHMAIDKILIDETLNAKFMSKINLCFT